MSARTRRLPGVDSFHLSRGVGQIRTGLIVAVQRQNLIVVSAGQRILRADDLNIVSHAGLKPVARLGYLFVGEDYALIGNVHFAAGGGHLRDGGPYLESNLVALLKLLLRDLTQLEVGAGALCAD